MTLKRIALAACALALVAAPASARKTYSHQKYFEHYEGTKTCLKCHKKQARSFFHSQHYQWKATASNVVGAKDRKLGKINMINDFCTNPLPTWIGEWKNKDGKIVEEGCSKCHPGRGIVPTENISDEQLENIDCLICHASGYRRNIYEKKGGGYEWKPILWKNRVGLDSVSKRISLPTRTMCLRCHAGSGGGPNYKRGDLEYKLTECDADFDVHMAKDGNDMQCIDCHQGEDHKIAGPGADIAGNEMPDKNILCNNDDCHGNEPHEQKILNMHTRRVFCTACHIPVFAKDNPTNTVRDWSKSRYSEKKGKYTYTAKFGKELTPVLRWWNGKTTIMQVAGQPVKKDEKGEIMVAVPVGAKDDPNSKIFAFKEYHAVMPVLKDKQWILPILTGDFYVTGDMDAAVKKATEEFYGIKDAQFEWAPTIHYMGLFHEVSPASKAVGCLGCHSGGSRIDWQALGYEGDPMMALLQKSH